MYCQSRKYRQTDAGTFCRVLKSLWRKLSAFGFCDAIIYCRSCQTDAGTFCRLLKSLWRKLSVFGFCDAIIYSC